MLSVYKNNNNMPVKVSVCSAEWERQRGTQAPRLIITRAVRIWSLHGRASRLERSLSRDHLINRLFKECPNRWWKLKGKFLKSKGKKEPFKLLIPELSCFFRNRFENELSYISDVRLLSDDMEDGTTGLWNPTDIFLATYSQTQNGGEQLV